VKELLKALKSLESVNGVIQPTPANLAQVEIMRKRCARYWQVEYLEAVASFVGQFDSQAFYLIKFTSCSSMNLLIRTFTS
jgi:hypothetical protein